MSFFNWTKRIRWRAGKGYRRKPAFRKQKSAQPGLEILEDRLNPSPLPAPVIFSPVDGANTVVAKPTISISQVPGNQGIRVLVSSNPDDLTYDSRQTGNLFPSDGFNAVFPQNTTNITSPVALHAGIRYWLEAHALGSTLEQAGYWSNPISFTVTTPTTVAARLIVHTGSVVGPVASGATVTYRDGNGQTFTTTTNANGLANMSGVPGNWTITISKAGQTTNTWTQAITINNGEWNAFFVTTPTTPTTPTTVAARLIVHTGSVVGPVASGATVTYQDGNGQTSTTTTNANGLANMSGVPGNWTITISKAGQTTNTWTQAITINNGEWNAYFVTTPTTPTTPTAQDLARDTRILALLDTLAYAEGTDRTIDGLSVGYDVMVRGVGSVPITDFSRHPRVMVYLPTLGDWSNAAGRYQFLGSTWDDLKLPDFGPVNQDIGAVMLMQNRGMIAPLLSGDIRQAIANGNRVWASLPGSPLGQSTVAMDTLMDVYYRSLTLRSGATPSP